MTKDLKLPQPEWQMDPSPHYFVTSYSSINPAISEEIKDKMENYEKTCALAKVKMYFEIYNILLKNGQIQLDEV
jgi:hypothetical protein